MHVCPSPLFSVGSTHYPIDRTGPGTTGCFIQWVLLAPTSYSTVYTLMSIAPTRIRGFSTPKIPSSPTIYMSLPMFEPVRLNLSFQIVLNNVHFSLNLT